MPLPVVIAALLLAACNSKEPLVTNSTANSGPVLDENYRLGPGDVLDVKVFKQDDLSGDYQVDERGKIAFPLIGSVDAANRTAGQVRQDIVAQLKDGYLVQPRVTVAIGKYRNFYIIGGVRTPGQYEYRTGLTILHAIALAGGHSDLARRRQEPTLRRESGPLPETVTIHTPLYPGDVVEIPERRRAVNQ